MRFALLWFTKVVYLRRISEETSQELKSILIGADSSPEILLKCTSDLSLKSLVLEVSVLVFQMC